MGVVQGGFRCTGEHPAFLDALRMLGGDGVLQSLEAG
jgi:hypothetical protein